MKHMNSSHQMWFNHKLMTAVNVPSIVNRQLTEEEIIQLSDKFLTPGFHYLKVDAVSDGRSLIKMFLDSLNYHHEVASLATTPIEPKVLDIYQALHEEDLLKKSPYNFVEFLCSRLYSDFLWIEATSDLIAAPWFYDFEQTLFDLNFDKVMPIMVISYQGDGR